MPHEPLNKPRLIRFTEAQNKQLETFSKELEIPVADLVRHGVELFLIRLRYGDHPVKEKDGQPTPR